MTELTIIPASGAAFPAEPFRSRHLIDGAWKDSSDGAVSERHSPAHGVLVSVAARGGLAETEAAIAAARRAFDAGDWPRSSGKHRATILLKVADLIERDLERIALIETLESGKPISQARGEIEGAGGPLALCRVAGPHHARGQPQFAGARHAGCRPEGADRRRGASSAPGTSPSSSSARSCPSRWRPVARRS
jgi:hypothetical protein